MKMNLNTKLDAYPKLSSSILNNYVTKEDLGNTLNNYVTEAPVDGNAYSRKDKNWAALKPSTLLEEVSLYYGSNGELQLDTIQEILDLQSGEKLIPPTEHTYNITYNIPENGYFWVVATQSITSIRWVFGLLDYIAQTAKISTPDNVKTYFCYRIREELIPQTLELSITL